MLTTSLTNSFYDAGDHELALDQTVFFMQSSNISGSMLVAIARPDKLRPCSFMQEGEVSLPRVYWICCSLEGSQKIRGNSGWLSIQSGKPFLHSSSTALQNVLKFLQRLQWSLGSEGCMAPDCRNKLDFDIFRRTSVHSGAPLPKQILSYSRMKLSEPVPISRFLGYLAMTSTSADRNPSVRLSSKKKSYWKLIANRRVLLGWNATMRAICASKNLMYSCEVLKGQSNDSMLEASPLKARQHTSSINYVVLMHLELLFQVECF